MRILLPLVVSCPGQIPALLMLLVGPVQRQLFIPAVSLLSVFHLCLQAIGVFAWTDVGCCKHQFVCHNFHCKATGEGERVEYLFGKQLVGSREDYVGICHLDEDKICHIVSHITGLLQTQPKSMKSFPLIAVSCMSAFKYVYVYLQPHIQACNTDTVQTNH